MPPKPRTIPLATELIPKEMPVAVLINPFALSLLSAGIYTVINVGIAMKQISPKLLRKESRSENPK